MFLLEGKVSPLIDSPITLCNQPRRLLWELYTQLILLTVGVILFSFSFSYE